MTAAPLWNRAKAQPERIISARSGLTAINPLRPAKSYTYPRFILTP